MQAFIWDPCPCEFTRNCDSRSCASNLDPFNDDRFLDLPFFGNSLRGQLPHVSNAYFLGAGCVNRPTPIHIDLKVMILGIPFKGPKIHGALGQLPFRSFQKSGTPSMDPKYRIPHTRTPNNRTPKFKKKPAKSLQKPGAVREAGHAPELRLRLEGFVDFPTFVYLYMCVYTI